MKCVMLIHANLQSNFGTTIALNILLSLGEYYEV